MFEFEDISSGFHEMLLNKYTVSYGKKMSENSLLNCANPPVSIAKPMCFLPGVGYYRKKSKRGEKLRYKQTLMLYMDINVYRRVKFVFTKGRRRYIDFP